MNLKNKLKNIDNLNSIEEVGMVADAAVKRIEALEKALRPFAKYGELSASHRPDELVVGLAGYNSKDEPDGIDLLARHFSKADTVYRAK